MRYWPMLMLLVAIPAGANDETEKNRLHFDGENTLEYHHSSVSGPGKASSFLNRGGSVNERLSLRAEYRADDGIDYRLNTTIGATDNPRIDPENISVERLTLRRTTQATEISIGDFLANFSQYSINASLKGAQFQLLPELHTGTHFTILAGLRKSNWEYLWQDEEEENKDSHVYGLRAGTRYGPLELALNLVHGEDNRLEDISENTGRSAAEIVHSTLGSLDWRLRLGGGALQLDGETAISHHDSNQTSQTNDWAHRLRAQLRTTNHRSWLQYEYVEPDFTSLYGSAAIDRERLRLRSSYSPTKDLSINLNASISRDNVHGQLDVTNHLRIIELRVTANRLMSRRTLSGNVGTRYQHRYNSATGVNDVDSQVDTLFAGLSDRFGKLRVNMDYRLRQERDRTANDNGGLSHVVDAGFSTSFKVGDNRIRPFLRGQWESRALSSAADSDTLTASAGFSATIVNNLLISVSSIVTDRYSESLDADSDGRRVMADIRYRIRGDRGNVVRLRYTNSDQRFESNGRDYEENHWILSWMRQF